MNFQYSKEWYEKNYGAEWISKITTIEDVKKTHEAQVRGKLRFDIWFKNIELKGKLLELGFNDGKTAVWLTEKYPELIIDILEWNSSVAKIGELLQEEYPNINKMFLKDCTKVPVGNTGYDVISAIDFYEHVPYEVYIKSLAENHRLLKKNGLLLIYFGTTNLKEHINLRNIYTIKNDLENNGFEVKKEIRQNPLDTVHDILLVSQRSLKTKAAVL